LALSNAVDVAVEAAEIEPVFIPPRVTSQVDAAIARADTEKDEETP
ncbi:hypothetical protein LCGC14_2765730, partial [marine sediment metagenome]